MASKCCPNVRCCLFLHLDFFHHWQWRGLRRGRRGLGRCDAHAGCRLCHIPHQVKDVLRRGEKLETLRKTYGNITYNILET